MKRVPPDSPARMLGPALSWQSQVVQYPRLGSPGVGYFAGEVPGAKPVDCLLWRDDNGLVRGILNHYPMDYPPYEREGNVNVWVDPAWQRRGIASTLVQVCEERWGSINFEQQSYSDSGLAFMEYLTTEGS